MPSNTSYCVANDKSPERFGFLSRHQRWIVIDIWILSLRNSHTIIIFSSFADGFYFGFGVIVPIQEFYPHTETSLSSMKGCGESSRLAPRGGGALRRATTTEKHSCGHNIPT